MDHKTGTGQKLKLNFKIVLSLSDKMNIKDFSGVEYCEHRTSTLIYIQVHTYVYKLFCWFIIYMGLICLSLILQRSIKLRLIIAID